MPLTIEPNALYTHAELEKLCRKSGITWSTLQGRIRARRVLQGTYLGSDLLKAISEAEPIKGGKPRKQRPQHQPARQSTPAPVVDQVEAPEQKPRKRAPNGSAKNALLNAAKSVYGENQ